MVIRKYRCLLNRLEPVAQHKLSEHKTPDPVIMPSDVKLITLADRAPETKSFFSVHNLADYRRSQTQVLLIPNVKAEVDRLYFDREKEGACTPIL